MNASPPTRTTLALLDRLAQARRALAAEIGQRIVGQDDVVDNLLAALLAGGHALLVGVPGLAKTLLVSTLAQALDLDFKRIQFTPDLMPSRHHRHRGHRGGSRRPASARFRFVHGPIFANIVLADEINRTPPKTQAALLEAMQEHAGHRRRADATSCPSRSSCSRRRTRSSRKARTRCPKRSSTGSCSRSSVGYPSREEEEQIVTATTGDER